MDTAQTNPSTAAIDSLFEGTGAIDMTPDMKTDLTAPPEGIWVTLPHDFSPTAQAPFNQVWSPQISTPEASASQSPTTPSAALSPLLRTETTARHADDVMGSLDFAAVRLEGAMYRLGYLESQVDVLQEQLKVLSEFRSRAAKAVIIERENMQLQRQMSEYEEELDETHKILEKLNQSKAWHLFRWLFRIPL